ncbi:MAG: DUF805 domain-containing protein [Akkermansia sp.]|nr:DUF805 domain-containing protein [Akkermansia sp.]
MPTPKYYYLNEEQKPQGPFTLEQLAALRISGAIHEKTKVATAGDSNWKALDEQEWVLNGEIQTEQGEKIPFSSGVGVEPGECPKCRESLSGWVVPAECPKCGYTLRASNDGFWANLLFAGRRFFSTRGRATRKEFWAFHVGMIPVMILWFILLIVGIVYISSDIEDFNHLCACLEKYVIYTTVMYTFLWIPYFCMYVRRLHDLGWSGWWSFVLSAVNIVYLVVALLFIGDIARAVVPECKQLYQQYSTAVAQLNENGQDEEETDPAAEEKIAAQELQLSEQLDKDVDELFENKQMELASTPMGITAIVLNTISTLSAIMLLVIGCIDSRRGPNRYGPSVKYPRG